MSWQVTRQAPDQVRTDQAGNTTNGVVVYFTTGAGNESSVFIADTIYGNVQATKDAIDAKAQIVDSTAALVSDDYQS